MEILFSGSIPKDYNRCDENEDIFNIHFEDHKLRIALSDGATVSYDSKNWAKALVDYFIKTGMSGVLDMRKIMRSYHSRIVKNENMTIIQKHGLKQGSFATFLGLEYGYINNQASIVGVGDSIVALIEHEKLIEAFPHTTSAQFNNRPQMLSTKNRGNGNLLFLQSKERSKFYKTWNLEDLESPTLLCMSDALGEWAMREMEQGNSGVWAQLMSINDLRDFWQFVHVKRLEHAIKTDDTTLITVRL